MTPIPTRAIRVNEALWTAAQRKATAHSTTITAEIVRFLAGWALFDPTDPELAIAFLRACHSGDESGARVIIENTNLLDLLFAVAAFCNDVGEGQIVNGKPIGSRQWDQRLALCLDEAARQRMTEEGSR